MSLSPFSRSIRAIKVSTTFLVALPILMVIGSFTPSSVGAQIKIENIGSDRVYGDFVVGPGKNELTLEPGTSKTINITVTNRMGSTRGFSLDSEDFTGTNDPTQPILLLGNERGPYSLKDFISVEESEFTLRHGERAVVPITVSIPLDAEPGGLYGSVLISTVSDPNEEKGTGSTAVISRIGSLFFVTVPGDIKKEGKLFEFTTSESKKFYSKGPIDFDILYENSGNIYLNPYGYVTITNMLGKEIGKVEVKPWFALPGSLRLREVSFDRPMMMGRYTATLSLNRGYDDIVETRTYSFYVLPIKLISLWILGCILFLLALRYLFSKLEIKVKR